MDMPYRGASSHVFSYKGSILPTEIQRFSGVEKYLSESNQSTYWESLKAIKRLLIQINVSY